MDTGHDTSTNHTDSRLRQPQFVSSSQHNLMNQQASSGLKRPNGNVVGEPAPKRKQLSEQAAEYPARNRMIPEPKRVLGGLSLLDASSKAGIPAQRAKPATLRNGSLKSSFASSVSRVPPPTSALPKIGSQPSKLGHARSASQTTNRPQSSIGYIQHGPTGGKSQSGVNGMHDLSFPSLQPRSPRSSIPRSVRRGGRSNLRSLFTQDASGERRCGICPTPSRSLSQALSRTLPQPAKLSVRSMSRNLNEIELGMRKCNIGNEPPDKSDGFRASTPRNSPARQVFGPLCNVADNHAEVRRAFSNLVTAVNAVRKCYPHKWRSPCKTPLTPGFLTKETNTKTFEYSEGWNVEDKVNTLDSNLEYFKDILHGTLVDKKTMDETLTYLKSRLSETESKYETLAVELNTVKTELNTANLTLESERRTHQHDIEDRKREHRNEMDQFRRTLNDEMERQKREHREQLEATERHWKNTLDDLKAQQAREVQELRSKLDHEQDDINQQLAHKSRELDDMRGQLEDVKGNLDRERTLRDNLSVQLTAKETSIVQLEAQNRSLKVRIEFLESGSKAQSEAFARMEADLRNAELLRDQWRDKLIKEEAERRVLFNKYQELKGNIRVMCRVRPTTTTDADKPMARIEYPDAQKSSNEILVMGPEERSSMGTVSRKANAFEFDRVFGPSVQNEEVFGEISQLVQSALDGYNVCIFCYGQTGSGKTFTMSSDDGMIPRATHMIYDTITRLRDKSWEYSMQGSFVEVYNEELQDLLWTPSSASAGDGAARPRLEIRHDEVRRRTTITNCRTVTLDSAERVEEMLARAARNRAVAATKANEQSSRSHSVFILRLVGENSATGERCEGTLNLVDLAGSERLKQSQAEGDRMRETQNINRSLSSLGDVIEALGAKAKHIPYRNSKLTHLLQYSLGGNSKTLMFVMVSPLEPHLQETLASLKFATKVHNTHIGTAKTNKKVAPSLPSTGGHAVPATVSISSLPPAPGSGIARPSRTSDSAKSTHSAATNSS